MYIMDRYVSLKYILPSKFQLLGTASLFIASKLFEVFIPSANGMAELSGKLYDKNDVIAMEKLILAALEHRVIVRTTYEFAEHLLQGTLHNFPINPNVVIDKYDSERIRNYVGVSTVNHVLIGW